MSSRARKVGLVAHVVSSVGWLGAVATTLVLGVVGLTSQDPQLVRAVYLAMEPTGWYVLVPLSLASLLTGLVQSLGTSWGLFRHYWVVAKLLINVVSSVILLLYMETLGALADIAAATPPPGDLGALRSGSATLHASAAVILLLAAAGLSVYKPRGLTRHGWRKRQELLATRPA